MPLRFALTIKSHPRRLGAVAQFAQHAARACGLDEDQVFQVQTALDEACSNVMEHAYKGRTGGTLAIECAKKGTEFVVTVRDHGEPFDPRQVAVPKTRDPLSKRSIGGLGLYFIYKMMDRVEWVFSSEGNLLTMTKKIKRKVR